MTARKLNEEWVHLGLGATAEPLEPFDGMAWYARYAEQHADDGKEARLVSMSSFSKDWDVWEMHPHGAELVLCLSGAITLVQELDGGEQLTTIGAGEYVINPPGVWHTANVADAAEALFITAGIGTEHRPR